MAIYHFSSQTISRKSGRSSVAAAAYRAGEKMIDGRTGEVADYSRKKVLGGAVFLPGGGTMGRSDLWNAVEAKHKRGDAVVAREFEISLPRELDEQQCQALAFEYAKELADRYGVAVDVNLHPPDRVTDKMLRVDPDRYFEIDPVTGVRHNGNWHMHIMLSACHVDENGAMGKKAVELDPIHCQRAKIPNAMDEQRPRWAELCNAHLAQAGFDVRIDHRSFAERGIDQEPTTHHGSAARAIEAKTGEKSDRRLADEAAISARARESARQKIEEATIAAEIVAAQREISALERDLSETRDPLETNPDQNIIAAAPLSSYEIRKQLEQARQKLFDPHQRVAMSKAINGAKADLDKIVDKRVAVFERLWALRDDLDNRIPDERKQLQGVINAWRKKNFVRARLHDQGISKSAELASYQRALSQIDQNKHGVGKRYYQELKVWNDLRDQHIGLEARIEKAISGGLAIMYAKLAPLQAEVDRLENELDQALEREQTRDAVMPDDSPAQMPSPSDVIDQNLQDDDSSIGDRHQRYQRPRN